MKPGSALAVASILLSVAVEPPAARAEECPALSVIDCGHRGTGTNGGGNPFPENTLPSYAQAAVEGAEMIELDVQHTSDGALVVMHDDTVDRTTDGTGCVGDLTLAEIQQLDAAYGKPQEGTGVTVPTFAEVLAAVDLPINVEIKINEDAGCPTSDKQQLAADVAAAIAADGKSRSIVVSSFDAEVLDDVEAIDGSIYTGLLTLAAADGAIAIAHGFDALNLSIATVRADVVEEMHAAGLDVNVWTEDDPASMKLWLDFGVDMIITNDPDVFATARAEWCDAYVPPDDGGDGGGCSAAADPSGAWLALLALLALSRGRARRV